VTHNLVFSQLIEYDAGQTGIIVPLTLKVVGKTVALEAKIDTGATNCIFARRIGEELGLDIESGLPKRIATATGSFLTYEHAITMSILDFDFDVLACFAADDAFQKNVLGRYGFLMQIQLGLVDYEGKLYLAQLL
jgi:predicted aspartyl protease